MKLVKMYKFSVIRKTKSWKRASLLAHRSQALGMTWLYLSFLEKEMATHSSILAWRIPWTEEPGQLQFMGSQVRHDLVPFLSHGSVDKEPPAMKETRVQFLDWEDPLEKEMATHSSILDKRIPWTEEPGRLWSMGSQESDMT